jgi:hypothetical protein
VCDILYAPEPVPAESSAESEEDLESDTEQEDDETGFDDAFSTSQVENQVPRLTSKSNIAAVIKKVRSLVNLFRRSPAKSDVLQKYVLLEHGKELTLLRDSKTRWNSMMAMIERFLLLRKAVGKALVDLGKNMDLSEDEFELLSDLTSALKPIQLGVEALSRRDATLLTADGVFRFIFSQLCSQDQSKVSVQLAKAIKRRIAERRQTNLVSLLRYLQDPECLNEKDEIFPMPPKRVLLNLAKSILLRLFPNSTDERDEADDKQETDINSEESLLSKLESCIQGSTSNKVAKAQMVVSSIDKEFVVFGATGARTPNLELLYNAMLTIPPTSVESERAFSAAGLFVTKLRCRLSDKSVNSLCVLRAHYLEKDK